MSLRPASNQAEREIKRADPTTVEENVSTPWDIDPKPRDGASYIANRLPQHIAPLTIPDLVPLAPCKQADEIADLVSAEVDRNSTTATTTLEAMLAEGMTIESEGSKITTEAVVRAMQETIVSCSFWATALAKHEEDMKEKGEGASAQTRAAKARLLETLSYATAMAPTVPVDIQLATFVHLRCTLQTAKQVAPPELFRLSSRTSITSSLRTVHFAEQMVDRCRTAHDATLVVQKHIRTTGEQWLAIANYGRRQACSFLADYTVPLTSAVSLDLESSQRLLAMYIGSDPLASTDGSAPGPRQVAMSNVATDLQGNVC
jgi:hypothetical protein